MPKTTKKPPKPLRFAGKHAKLFATDAARYGRETAIFNQGFLRGWDDGFKKGKRRARE